MRARATAVLVAFALALGGCDFGRDSAEDVLAETADNLGEIRSGWLEMSLVVDPRAGRRFGFRLRGPFSLRERGLPLMRIAYTQIASGRQATVTLVSDGREAWTEIAGRRSELSADQVEQLETAATTFGRGEDGDEERLRLDHWIEDAELSDGGSVDGAETDRVRGRLDVVAAVNGLLQATSGPAREARIAGREAERLRQATRSSLFDAYTGEDDRLLRRLTLAADFGFGVPRALRRALGTRVGGKVTFRLVVTNPNQPVSIRP